MTSVVERIELGGDVKAELGAYFSQWYDVTHVDSKKKDFEFTRDGKTTSAKLIVDEKAGDTSRLFIEVWSVYELGRYGWAWTTDADLLLYFASPDTIYIAKPIDVRQEIPYWMGVFGTVSVKRKGFHRVGIPVSEEVFRDICVSVRRLD